MRLHPKEKEATNCQRQLKVTDNQHNLFFMLSYSHNILYLLHLSLSHRHLPVSSFLLCALSPHHPLINPKTRRNTREEAKSRGKVHEEKESREMKKTARPTLNNLLRIRQRDTGRRIHIQRGLPGIPVTSPVPNHPTQIQTWQLCRVKYYIYSYNTFVKQNRSRVSGPNSLYFLHWETDRKK